MRSAKCSHGMEAVTLIKRMICGLSTTGTCCLRTGKPSRIINTVLCINLEIMPGTKG